MRAAVVGHRTSWENETHQKQVLIVSYARVIQNNLPRPVCDETGFAGGGPVALAGSSGWYSWIGLPWRVAVRHRRNEDKKKLRQFDKHESHVNENAASVGLVGMTV